MDRCVFLFPSERVRRSLLAGLVATIAFSPASIQADTCPRFVEASQGLPTHGEWRTHPALADVNGDGRIDIAGLARKAKGPRVWVADHANAWTEAATGLVIPGFSCGVGVDLADLNGDGHVDLAVADHCQGLFVFHGNGKGVWKLTASRLFGDQRGFDDVQLSDLDRDGDLDLVAIASFRGGFTVLRNDGRGKWTELSAESTGLPAVGMGSDLEIGDVNGDGVPDVAAAYSGGITDPPPPDLHKNVLWTSNGDGKYHAATAGLFKRGRTFGVALGDVDHDGRLDLAVSRDREAPLQVFLNRPDGAWAASNEGLPGARSNPFFGVKLADVTGDGLTDLVAVEHRRIAIHLWRGDGTGRWETCTETGLPSGEGEELRGWGLAIGDVNEDGLADIVAGFGNNNRGSLQVWLQQR